MPYIQVGTENSGNIDLYYEDHGTGKPVLLEAGCRVIPYERRGFGDSSKPVSGYDYDTFASDLHKLVTKLDLRDAALVGFSMGGGEVARYLGTHGTERVKQAVFIASIPPFLLKTPDNPGGVDGSIFDGIKKAIAADRPAFLSKFLSDFYNVDILGGKLISDQAVQMSWNIGAGASPKGTLDCVAAWLTDFRKDLQRIDIPTLVIHGDADRILPLAATGQRTHEAVKGSRLVVVDGGPHGLTWTHAEQVNQELRNFLGQAVSRSA